MTVCCGCMYVCYRVYAFRLTLHRASFSNVWLRTGVCAFVFDFLTSHHLGSAHIPGFSAPLVYNVVVEVKDHSFFD